MFRIPDHYLFKPAESLEGILPLLLIAAFLVFLLFWLGFIIYLVNFIQKRHREWERFNTLAQKYGLTKKENSFLKNKLKLHPITLPVRILLDPDCFEEWIHPLEMKATAAEIKLTHAIRIRLLGKDLQPGDTILNTHDFPLGTELQIANCQFPLMPITGRILENAPEGLLVIIHENEKYTHLIQEENEVEVIAAFPHHPSVEFMSWVKSAAPGPERLVILEHSSFVINKVLKKQYRQDPPPQFWHCGHPSFSTYRYQEQVGNVSHDIPRYHKNL